MVNVIIDNIKLSVSEGTTIMKAAESAGISIPKLCYLENINEIGACRVCVVEIKGHERLVTSCNNYVEDGMVIFTNSAKVRRNRKQIVEMILAGHKSECTTCVRSRNCTLQNLAGDLNINSNPYTLHYEDNEWNKDFPLIRDSSKCIKCMRCVSICKEIQGANIWDSMGVGIHMSVNVSGNIRIEASKCTLCGQCITHCPVGALKERDDIDKVWEAIDNPAKTVIVQVAPAVRTAWGEEIGLEICDASMGKIVDALRKIGFDYVFDTTFTADLTIMEESTELLRRFKEKDTEKLPMFTSCCPGWVRFIKTEYPHLLSRLSTTKSPQQMFGSIMKTYFAMKNGIKPEDIVTVSIMPCLAKKAECEQDLYYGEYAGKAVDVVLTTREFCRMIKMAGLNLTNLKEEPCDELFKDTTSAGVIFGYSGGVMEAALRTASFILEGKNHDADAFKIVRSDMFEAGWKEAEVIIAGEKIKAAVVNSLGKARKLIDACERGEVRYDFVEVMACPGGCVGGGGQPIKDGMELSCTRSKVLRNLDETASVRFSHENTDVQKLYKEFLKEPCGYMSHILLHTKHQNNISM